MCDLKSFSFSHHFGSGFKYFSAVIICKLSKILNLRLSGGAHIQIYIHIQGFQKRGYEKGFVGRFPKVLFICVYLYISLLNWFHDSSPERGGDGRRQVYQLRKTKSKKNPETDRMESRSILRTVECNRYSLASSLDTVSLLHLGLIELTESYNYTPVFS